MKRRPVFRLPLGSLPCILGLSFLSVIAASPAPKPPALQDVIADPNFLRDMLHAKALIVTNASTGKVPDEVTTAIKRARLDDQTQFISLPREATQPEAKLRITPTIPMDLIRSGISLVAKYLYIIGADGAIQGIYCYESSNPGFALAGAKALVNSKFTPARIEGTAVPVVAYQTMHVSLKEPTLPLDIRP